MTWYDMDTMNEITTWNDMKLHDMPWNYIAWLDNANDMIFTAYWMTCYDTKLMNQWIKHEWIEGHILKWTWDDTQRNETEWHVMTGNEWAWQ